MAAGRARRGADRGISHFGRRSAKDGNLWLHSLCPAFLPGCSHAPQGTGVDDRAVDYRHHLWRSGFPDAEGYEEAGGVLVGQPPWFLHFGNLCLEPGGTERFGAAADQPWNFNGGAVLDCWHSLRAAAYA